MSLFFPNPITRVTEFYICFVWFFVNVIFPSWAVRSVRAGLVFVFAFFSLAPYTVPPRGGHSGGVCWPTAEPEEDAACWAPVLCQHFLVGLLHETPLVLSLCIHYKACNLVFRLPVDFRVVIVYKSYMNNNEIEVWWIISVLGFMKMFYLITLNHPKFCIICIFMAYRVGILLSKRMLS